MTAAERAAATLLAEKDALAGAITDAMYAERPELMARYGAAGREKCLQDLRYTLEHLIPAVDMGEPALFAGYARWLDGLLRARDVDAADVRQSLATAERVIGERLPADEAAAVALVVRAGVDALAEAGP